MAKTQYIDLNCAPLELYPVIKVLTESDMPTSQIVLPRHSVEEFIVPNMPDLLINRLTEGEKRAEMWIVDDEKLLEHFLMMEDCDHQYSITGWGIVSQNRELKVGHQIRFGWMDEKLHFIVTAEGTSMEERDFAEIEVDGKDFSTNEENKTPNEEQGEGDAEAKAETMDENPCEPQSKKQKIDRGGGGSMLEDALPINP